MPPLPQHQDHWIATPGGGLLARSWQPETTKSAPAAPLLMFHDSLGCVHLWRDFPALLAATTGRRVIAYDRLGFGLSDPRSGDLPTSFVAEEALTTLPLLQQQLQFGDFIALGHSVGGGMAVHCAARHPQSCLALVTMAAQAFVEDKTLAGIRVAKAEFQAPGAVARLERYHGAKARWVLDAWTQTWLSDGLAHWSLRDVLPEIRCPTLVIHGALDEYGSDAHPRTIAAMVQGPSQLDIMDGVRHMPHREHPDQVIARIAAFI